MTVCFILQHYNFTALVALVNALPNVINTGTEVASEFQKDWFDIWNNLGPY